jgi:hypothetical protein
MLCIALIMVAKLRVMKLSCYHYWVLEVSMTANISNLKGLDPMRHLRWPNKTSYLTITIFK